jgi:hypothetical protein
MKKMSGLLVAGILYSIQLSAQDFTTNGMHTIIKQGYTVNWGNSHLELRTDDNTTPWMTFHRAGYTWRAFGYDGTDFIDNVSNKFLLSHNFNNYAPTLTGVGASGNWNINASTATQWGGYSANFSDYGTEPGWLTGADIPTNQIRPFRADQIKAFLGLPSGGETLQSVTDRGYSTSNNLALKSVGAKLEFDATGDYYNYIQSNKISGVNYMSFAVGNAERMRIIDGGNVGIGTTTPTAIANYTGLTINNPGGSLIDLQSNGATVSRLVTTATDTYMQNIGSGGIIFSAGGADRMTATAAGNIGIGTIIPDAKLRVDAANGTALKVTGANGYLLIDNVNAGLNYYSANVAHEFQINGQTKMLINTNGNIGIGTSNPGSYKLAVEGIIGARKIKVTQEIPWADYVFDSSYQLTPLHQVEKYIQANKHLQDVPSAAEIKKNGLDLGDNQVVLLKKIEELTLYIIEQQKELKSLSQEVKKLQKKLK